MHILFAASECFPFVKIGGLADVVGGLPKALNKLGLEVSVVIPWYKQVSSIKNQVSSFKIKYDNKTEEVIVNRSTLPGTDISVYLLENSHYLSQGGVYANQELHSQDEIERFIFFSQAVVELARHLPGNASRVDCIHCHDWHTSLIPLIAQNNYKTVLTIHNLGRAYQGKTDLNTISKLNNLNEKDLRQTGDDINILLQGIEKADYLTTVSPTYASEIKTSQLGEGLDGYLRQKDNLFGILNGIDTKIWNPWTDSKIPYCFTNNLQQDKNNNKQALLKELLLSSYEDGALIGMVTRVAEQKGFDILLPILENVLVDRKNKIVILGVGDQQYENNLTRLAAKFNNLKFLKKFDERLAHLIYAASDLFLMPSHFEPCGIGQLVAMAYGTLPLVRKTGGLADSVRDLETGFVFEQYDSQSLAEKLKQALETYYQQPKEFANMQVKAMAEDFSWENSAKEYLKLYQKLI